MSFLRTADFMQVREVDFEETFFSRN